MRRFPRIVVAVGGALGLVLCIAGNASAFSATPTCRNRLIQSVTGDPAPHWNSTPVCEGTCSPFETACVQNGAPSFDPIPPIGTTGHITCTCPGEYVVSNNCDLEISWIVMPEQNAPPWNRKVVPGWQCSNPSYCQQGTCHLEAIPIYNVPPGEPGSQIIAYSHECRCY